MHVSGHACGLVLSKLLFIVCLLPLQKCEYSLLKVYCRLEGIVLRAIPHENYVSNNKPGFQAAEVLPDLDGGSPGPETRCHGRESSSGLSFTLVFRWMSREPTDGRQNCVADAPIDLFFTSLKRLLNA